MRRSPTPRTQAPVADIICTLEIMKPLRFIALCGCCALLGGCAQISQTLQSLPRDQKGWTSQIQRTRVLDIGVAAPEKDDKPIAQAEKKLVAQIAARLGATVKWREGNAHSLLDDAEARRLPIVVAQLPRDSPFAQKLGFSQSFYTRESDNTEYSIAVAPGENRLLLIIDQIIAENKRGEK